MEKTIRTQFVKEFLEAVLTLESVDECMDFFEDGKTYAEVANETGASTATISRVNRSLNYGNASYDKVFARLEEKNKA